MNASRGKFAPRQAEREEEYLMQFTDAIGYRELADFSAHYNGSPARRAMTNALANTELADVTFDHRRLRDDRFHFSVELPTLPATNQERSGRCWIFAGLNVLRERAAKTCGLERFELSQNFIAFWDKLEKCGYFLESVIDRVDCPVDDRTLCWILSTGVQDGGQWDMFVSLVEKYGVVPKEAMDETYQSSHTGPMNGLLNTLLRRGAARLQSLARGGADADALHKEKKDILREAYALLCTCLGEPPASFDFAWTDKDKAYHVDRGLTPKSFYEKYVAADLGAYVSVINSPTGDKPFYKTFTVDYLGNVAGGNEVRYLNLPMAELVSLAVRQLQEGEPVWFGSDVSKCGDRKRGIWDTEAFDYASAFGDDFAMEKGAALDYRESAMNHAMVLTGVELGEDGAPVRWKVQNSWSDENGDKGYYLMSAAWFDRFVYQAVIRRDLLTEAQRAALGEEPGHLPPWDPMGSLAD